jgi:16S rRNA (guanine966-N2)-methyltransferase
MRIIAGRNRGRKLAAPAGQTVRPSSDRLRQALFNILQHGKHGVEIDDAIVVDAFAGTGAIGLEALSRGAGYVVFIENEPTALESLRKNVALCNESEHAEITRADATQPPPAPAACDLAFLDPPYGRELASPALSALAQKDWFKDDALCIVELASSEQLVPPEGFEFLDVRTYGAAQIVILRWHDGERTASPSQSPE